jgi:hypothetical protein
MQCNYEGDIRLPDGREFKYQVLRLIEGESETVRYLMDIEVLEKRRQLFIDFRFRFYDSAFERGMVRDECTSILAFSRHWLRGWLQLHPAPVKLIERTPIFVEMR